MGPRGAPIRRRRWERIRILSQMGVGNASSGVVCLGLEAVGEDDRNGEAAASGSPSLAKPLDDRGRFRRPRSSAASLYSAGAVPYSTGPEPETPAGSGGFCPLKPLPAHALNLVEGTIEKAESGMELGGSRASGSGSNSGLVQDWLAPSRREVSRETGRTGSLTVDIGQPSWLC